jgi:Tol biopolymer transport system component
MVMLGVVILAVGAGFYAFRRTSIHLTKEQRTLTRLTFDEGLQTEPTWSPDARYVAYSSDRGGKFDIWVQQVSGGNPIQVTKSPGQNWQPDWSPDGKFIAYRSEEGDGGIFVIPALGGAGLERKIATFGYHPRWSSDGSQVLFEQLTPVQLVYIAQLDGGPPRKVLAAFLAQKKLEASSAAWYPDGKKITVWIADSAPTPGFWNIPIAGGPGIKLEIAAAVQKELAQASGDSEAGQQLGESTFSWSPAGDAIYFERGYRGARNIWKLQVDPQTMRATSIDRLTTGPGPDAGAAVSKDGKRLAFSSKSQRIQTWLFPFDAKTGQITGDGTAITSPGRTSVGPVISRDGMNVAYLVPHGEKSGLANLDVRNEVWVKSLVDGREAPVIADDGYSRWFPLWSPDGTRLVYVRRNLRRTSGSKWFGQATHDEEPFAATNNLRRLRLVSRRQVAGFCDVGRNLAGSVTTAPHAETATRKITSNHREYELYETHFSPNGRWIVFEAVADSPKLESALYVIPVAGGTWTRITDGRQHWDDKPRWSPDGRTIYFVSGSDGFFNVWGIRFDAATGKPVGQPFELSKFDRPRLMIPRWIPSVGFSLTQDKFVFDHGSRVGQHLGAGQPGSLNCSRDQKPRGRWYGRGTSPGAMHPLRCL